MTSGQWYGNRDSYTKESRALITRPDDTVFIQNAPHTYRVTEIPMVHPPETRTNRLEGVSRRTTKEGTMHNTMDQSRLDASGDVIHRYEIKRELSETGRSWLITVALPGGREAVVSRLRSHKEGNGF